MAANSYPALNDVMYSELVILTEKVADLYPEIRYMNHLPLVKKDNSVILKLFSLEFSLVLFSLQYLKLIFAFVRRECKTILRLTFFLLRTARREEQLVLMESGIGSPCLDCRYIFILTLRGKT